MENRLLITGNMQGYPDLDVTDDQFYPSQNYPDNGGKFVSIYETENGLELNGQYFFRGDQSSPIERQTYLKGNNLITAGTDAFYGQQFYDYDHSALVTLANIPHRNDDSFSWKYDGIISYTVDLEEFPDNNPPIINSNGGTKYAFSGELTNIQLDVSDQDGDALTYTLVDPLAMDLLCLQKLKEVVWLLTLLLLGSPVVKPLATKQVMESMKVK